MRSTFRPPLFSYFAFFVVISSNIRGQTRPSPTTSPSEITIETDKKEYYQGQPIHVDITVHDLSPKGTVLTDFAPEIYTVTWNGKPAEPTRWARLVPELERRSISHGGIDLAKDQSYTHTVLLSQWVDLSTAGHYELVVSRMAAEVGDNEFGHLVQSNRVTFEIKDGEPPPPSRRRATTSTTDGPREKSDN